MVWRLSVVDCVVAVERSVGSVLIRVFVFIQTTSHDVLLPFSNIVWFLGCLNGYACGNYGGSVSLG